MTQEKEKVTETGRLRRADASALERAQAQQIGTDFLWHYGRVTRLGCYSVGSKSENARSVTVLWESGGLSCQQGGITDQQWEVFKLAFSSTGMISVLSDECTEAWMYDYRFLEAVR